MSKKRKFDRVNYIPNQDKFQKGGLFNDAFRQELQGRGENYMRQCQLANKKK